MHICCTNASIFKNLGKIDSLCFVFSNFGANEIIFKVRKRLLMDLKYYFNNLKYSHFYAISVQLYYVYNIMEEYGLVLII